MSVAEARKEVQRQHALHTWDDGSVTVETMDDAAEALAREAALYGFARALAASWDEQDDIDEARAAIERGDFLKETPDADR